MSEQHDLEQLKEIERLKQLEKQPFNTQKAGIWTFYIANAVLVLVIYIIAFYLHVNSIDLTRRGVNVFYQAPPWIVNLSLIILPPLFGRSQFTLGYLRSIAFLIAMGFSLGFLVYGGCFAIVLGGPVVAVIFAFEIVLFIFGSKHSSIVIGVLIKLFKGLGNLFTNIFRIIQPEE